MISRYAWLLILPVVGILGCGKKASLESVSSAGLAKQPFLFRLHFLGVEQLTADTNAAVWLEMSKSPESQALWQQTLQKLARAPFRLYQQRGGTATNDFAGIVADLVSDLPRYESFIELAGNSNGVVEYALAIRLPADRRDAWRTNLVAIVENWTGSRSEALRSAAVGWQLKEQRDRMLFRLVHTGEWTLIGCGKDELPLQDQNLERIKRNGSPATFADDSWIEVLLDGPALSKHSQLSSVMSPLDAIGLPIVNLSLRGRDQSLRIDGTLVFEKTTFGAPEPWQIPTNIVREPIISLTAARDVSPILSGLLQAHGLRLETAPNQVFLWAGAAYPVQTLAAAPLRDAPIMFQSLATQLMARYNPALQTANAGVLLLTTNATAEETLRWTDIPPFLTPFLTTARDAGGDYLLGGTYPNWGEINSPVPASLFHHLASNTNLIYYDWEVTGPHTYAWRAILNLFRHYFETPRLQPESASIAWINSSSNGLANTVTEIRRTSANQLTFVRQGLYGFTGIELIALAHWLESPEFPLVPLARPKPSDP